MTLEKGFCIKTLKYLRLFFLFHADIRDKKDKYLCCALCKVNTIYFLNNDGF